MGPLGLRASIRPLPGVAAGEQGAVAGVHALLPAHDPAGPQQLEEPASLSSDVSEPESRVSEAELLAPVASVGGDDSFHLGADVVEALAREVPLTRKDFASSDDQDEDEDAPAL
jgi:hypothetical protein